MALITTDRTRSHVKHAYLCLSLDGRVCRMTGILGFPQKILVLLNGSRKQYIQVDIVFNYMCFVLDFRNLSVEKFGKSTFLVLASPVPGRCVLGT